MKSKKTPLNIGTPSKSNLRDAKIGLVVGVIVCLIGLAQVLSGQVMCRGGCWIITILKNFLPKEYESMASGLVTVTIGLTSITWGIWSFFKKKP
jgi:hypothetical protein